jgi:hypothetical protein
MCNVAQTPFFAGKTNCMLQNWLKPLPISFRKSIEPLADFSFGKNILLHGAAFPNLKGVRVALIGAGDKEANAVRETLFQTAFPFPKGTVADLGNLRRAEPSVLIPVLFELLSGGVLPILLAHREELARAQFLAYQEAKSLANLVVIDQTLRFSDPKMAKEEPLVVYAPLLQPRHPMLFHFGLVGLRTHIARCRHFGVSPWRHQAKRGARSRKSNAFRIFCGRSLPTVSLRRHERQTHVVWNIRTP